jgi:hypothetical protein
MWCGGNERAKTSTEKHESQPLTFVKGEQEGPSSLAEYRIAPTNISNLALELDNIRYTQVCNTQPGWL